MFQAPTRNVPGAATMRVLRLVFNTAVQDARGATKNAFLALFLNMVQMMIFIGIMYFIMYLMGRNGARIRGDTFVFIMTGVMMFITHTKTMGAVSGAAPPTSVAMQHSPMNSIIGIAGAALGTLYQQVFSVAFLLYGYHCAFTPITIDEPVGMALMMVLAWGYGIAVGLVVRAATPWSPRLLGFVATAYKRINVIASGKMLVANATPSSILYYFDWNPLFHIIDQGRGFVFLNYYPRVTSIGYVFQVMIACLIVGLLLEYYTRKYQSASWGARA